MRLYSGTARDENKNLIGKVHGTIQELSNWADNVIRMEGACSILIVPEIDGNLIKYWEAKHASDY